SPATPARPLGPTSSTTAATPARESIQPVAAKQAGEESETVVENDLYRITFTNRGAQVKSWILKKHTDDAGHPLNLVLESAASQYGYPLSLFTYDPGLRNKLNTALYVPSETGNATAPANIAFEYADKDGSVARKSFSFDHSYAVHYE